MNIFYLLIGVSLLAALAFLILFIRAVKTGQFEDTYTPSVRILFDDNELYKQKEEKQKQEKEKDENNKKLETKNIKTTKYKS